MPIYGQRVVMPEPFRVEVEAFEVPEPGPDQLLIETEASAISAGTELAVYTGVHQWLNDPTRSWPRFPFVPGYSAVGRVTALGEGVSTYQVGQRVVYDGRHTTHGLVDLAADRALIYPIAAHVPAEHAAFAAIARFPFTAVVQSGVTAGQSVAVLGLGVIGQVALRLFAACGAFPLVGIDSVASRRAVAASSPGVTALDLEDTAMREQLHAANHGQAPDIVVEATGNPQAVKLAMALVADGGKVVMVGSPRGIAGEVDFYWDLHGRSIQLIGAHGSAIGGTPREKFPYVRDRAMRLLVHFLESGKLRLDDIVTHYAHADASAQMYDGLLNRRDEFLGVSLHWGSIRSS
ncbi:zinc-binding alcohol dehydrogenase [Candidatus Gracilibacteria bacterium]|nr:zinc-binding alcohol dehydrogenase [Candidatus Gracilibacteria bacterium]